MHYFHEYLFHLFKMGPSRMTGKLRNFGYCKVSSAEEAEMSMKVLNNRMHISKRLVAVGRGDRTLGATSEIARRALGKGKDPGIIRARR